VQNQDTITEKAVREVLSHYADSLNKGDPESSLALYADEAALMTPNRDTLIGKEAIRQAYEGFAKMMAFDVRFVVHSVVPMAADWAYARTSSSGTTTNRMTHAVSQEANQEVFILKRNPRGSWHIAVYSFSSTNPQA
jgi:uncharacterized protein (TIGR02246 family)